MKTPVALVIGGLGGAVVAAGVLLPMLMAVRADLDEAKAEIGRFPDVLEERRLRHVAALGEEGKRSAELQRTNEHLETEMREVQAQVADTQRRLDRALLSGGTGDGSGGAGGPAGALERFPLYPIEPHAHMLRGLAWPELGAALARLPGAAGELASALGEGRSSNSISASARTALQRDSQPIARAAEQMRKADVAGSGPNGQVTHPAFVANALAAALTSAGVPLSGDQATRLADLSETASKQADRLGQRDASVLGVRHLLREATVRRDFADRVLRLLTPEQIAIVRPESTRGRVGIDIFGEGYFWGGLAQVLTFASRDELKQKLRAWVMRATSMRGESLDLTREEVDAWVNGLPDDFADVKADAVDEAGFPSVERVLESAQRAAKLLDDLLLRLQLPPEDAARVYAVSITFVPLATK